MPYTPLFSTYTQGENRVTSTILAVLERLPFPLCEYILQSLAQIEDGTQLLSFENQPRGENAVPDAKISSGFSFWIETKIVPNAVRDGQIREHLNHINNPAFNNGFLNKLIVLTPDHERPDVLAQFNGPDWGDTLAWASFDDLARIVKECVEPRENGATELFISVVREQERFLLNELLSFLDNANLTGRHVGQVLIVAGRNAWPEYERLDGFFNDEIRSYSAYICQPNRRFRPTQYIAFYADQQVKRIVPIIKYDWSFNEILLTEQGVANAINARIRELFGDNERDNNAIALRERLQKVYELLIRTLMERDQRIDLTQKVMILTGNDHDETVDLNHVIENNLINESGRAIPLTYGSARYFTLPALQNANTTSELFGQ